MELKFVLEPATFAVAKSDCELYGGKLVTVSASDLINYVAS